jgi:hypothetical protein
MLYFTDVRYQADVAKREATTGERCPGPGVASGGPRRLLSSQTFKSSSGISVIGSPDLAPRGLRKKQMATNFTVNGKVASTDAPRAAPLLWVIREQSGGRRPRGLKRLLSASLISSSAGAFAINNDHPVPGQTPRVCHSRLQRSTASSTPKWISKAL